MTITDTAVSGGTVGEAPVDVTIVNSGNITISGSTTLGNVTYRGSGSRITVSGALSAETVATIAPSAPAAGLRILSGDTAGSYTKFALDAVTAESYALGADGCLAAKATEPEDSFPVEISTDGTTWTGYSNLADAIAAIETSGTVRLNESVTAAGIDITDKTVTITDNGTPVTINRGGSYLFKLGGSTVLTLQGSLTLDGAAATSNNRMIWVGTGTTDNGAKLVMSSGVTISNNNAGGEAGAAAIVYGTLEMHGGTVSGNSTTGNGGAFNCANGSTLTITGGTISGNSAGGYGGAMTLYAGTATVSGGTISGNSASNHGGAIYAVGKAELNIQGGTITQNSTSKNGGAIQAAGGVVTISGGEITANTAANYGAGICAATGKSGDVTYYAVVNISGGSITGNQTTTAGRGDNIHISGSTTVNMTGGTISGTERDIQVAGTLNASGGAQMGNVCLASGKVINVAGELTAELAATVTPSAYTVDTAILTGDLTQYLKFSVADSAYIIDENGTLQAAPAAASGDEEV